MLVRIANGEDPDKTTASLDLTPCCVRNLTEVGCTENVLKF